MDDYAGRIQQVKTLENGAGVQYLIDESSKILENPLLLHNMEYELLYCTENVVTDDRLWNEIAENGVFSNDTIRFFLEECFIDDVANSKTIALLASDKLKYERLYGRVLNGFNNTIADLIAVACEKPFSGGDAMVFEAVCEKLSQEISTSDYYKSYGILYHEELICKLLDNNIEDKVIYSGHLSNLYEDLKANLYVAAADIGESDKTKLVEFRAALKEMRPEHKYAVYSGYIVIIASSDGEAPNIGKDLHELGGYLGNKNIRLGISGCFDNLYNMRKYYDEAVSMLCPCGTNGVD